MNRKSTNRRSTKKNAGLTAENFKKSMNPGNAHNDRLVKAEFVLEDGDVCLVLVIRRLLFNAARRRSRSALERSHVLVAVTELVESIDILDQLVREALGVERKLVEFAVEVASDGEVERHVVSHFPPQPERYHLTHEARVGKLADERRLADFLDRLARHGIGHRKRMSLRKPEAVSFLRELGGRIAAQVDPHVVVIV